MEKLVHNAETGEVINVVLSQEELLQVQKDKEQAAADKLLHEQSAEAKAALLDRLGINEAEAKLLLS